MGDGSGTVVDDVMESNDLSISAISFDWFTEGRLPGLDVLSGSECSDPRQMDLTTLVTHWILSS